MKIPLLLAGLAFFASACEKPPQVARAGTAPFAGSGLGPPMPLTAGQAQAKWSDVKAPAKMDAGKTSAIEATIRNEGSAAWVNKTEGKNAYRTVRVTYRWARPDGSVVVKNGARTDLLEAVPPGGSVKMANIQVIAPTDPGQYQLQLDLVQEGALWFNSSPAPIPVTVK